MREINNDLDLIFVEDLGRARLPKKNLVGRITKEYPDPSAPPAHGRPKIPDGFDTEVFSRRLNQKQWGFCYLIGPKGQGKPGVIAEVQAEDECEVPDTYGVIGEVAHGIIKVMVAHHEDWTMLTGADRLEDIKRRAHVFVDPKQLLLFYLTAMHWPEKYSGQVGFESVKKDTGIESTYELIKLAEIAGIRTELDWDTIDGSALRA